MGWAKTWPMFASCAPGLEPILTQELAGLGMDGVSVLDGGVGFMGRLDKAYLANLHLLTAGRVLLRLSEFKARSWDDFSRRLEAISWEIFLAAGSNLDIQIVRKGSPLRHSGRLAQNTLTAIRQRFKGLGINPPGQVESGAQPKPGKEAAQRIMIRAVERRVLVSLDTTGEHLHKRGYRKNPGPAPLREDLAAGLLLLSGYDGSAPLVDPMCGAGTLAIEAARLARGIAPASGRRLVMHNWPCHRKATWNHLLKKAAEGAAPSAAYTITAGDISPAALNAAKENAAAAGVANDIVFNQQDFFTAMKPEGQGLVVINPPYGKRMGSVRQAKGLVERAGALLRKDYKGWGLAMVLYRPEWLDILGLSDVRKVTAPHGGLKVSLAFGIIPIR